MIPHLRMNANPKSHRTKADFKLILSIHSLRVTIIIEITCLKVVNFNCKLVNKEKRNEDGGGRNFQFFTRVKGGNWKKIHSKVSKSVREHFFLLNGRTKGRIFVCVGNKSLPNNLVNRSVYALAPHAFTGSWWKVLRTHVDFYWYNAFCIQPSNQRRLRV